MRVEGENENTVGAYDIETEEGIRMEAKSAAYIQSWFQSKNSTIRFDIASKIGWDASTNTYLQKQRHSDVYVFCLLIEKDKSLIDHLDLDQWKFYVVSTEHINQEKPTQKTIGLSGLKELNPEIVPFDGINNAVKRAIN